MTSDLKTADYSFIIMSADLDKGKLNRSGRVRVDKIYTLSQSIIVKTFGRVNINVLARIRVMLQDLITKSP